MRNFVTLLLLLLLFMSSCDLIKDGLEKEPELTDYDKSLITYFNEIAFGLERGHDVIRKWETDLKIYIGGEPGPELFREVEKTIKIVNELATDGFKVILVNDSLQSNYYFFFGPGTDLAKIYPSLEEYLQSLVGFYSIHHNGMDQIVSGLGYVDITRIDYNKQRSLFIHTLTRSLGLTNVSSRYQKSVFYYEDGYFEDYTQHDKDLIRLMYHRYLHSGMDSVLVNEALVDILLNN